ncbi:MAG: hypothetical protein COA50_10765 [Flavobacteriaceae bacterium]|nr:MAG: hypothetical protein COA50_10765 [Flavobacteriaceae bacterium]
MLYRVVLLVLTFFSTYCFSQEIPDFGNPESHTYYVELLINSKDIGFKETLRQYDEFILNNPKNITAKVERCKFIENSYWDEYEDYNLKYDETEECIANLYDTYPENPKVLVYRAENLYAEEQLEVLEAASSLIDEDKDAWSNFDKAEISKMLGQYYQDENNWLALKHFKRSQRLNSNQDLSLTIARIQVDMKNLDEAKETLLSRIDTDTILWRMNQKANLLVELKSPNEALSLFAIISERDSTYIDNEEMATAMSDLDDYVSARVFLVKDTVQEWNKSGKLQTLFKHDLKYSETEVALATYRRMQQLNSNDDFFGIKRLKIFFKDVTLRWNLSECFHFMLFIISIGILFLIPYLWVLPLHYLGVYIKDKFKAPVPKLDFVWTMKHFWIISFLYLLAQFILTIAFYYEDTINYLFEVTMSYIEEEESIEDSANSSVFYILFMFALTSLILTKKALRHVFNTNLTLMRTLALSVGFLIFNGVLLQLLRLFIDIDGVEAAGVILNAKQEIMAILSEYGFLLSMLLVGIIGPIYEEIIFRGVLLGSLEKHLGFVIANVVQAVMFALVHFDLSLFIFYFVFGFITGIFVKRTQGLLTGIIFHCINNSFAVLVMYYVVKLTALPF